MTKTDDAVSQALDRVYATRPAAFVAERKKIVAELRAAGDKEGAARIAAAHRPTMTAWAINHVVRENPDVLLQFTDAIEKLRKTQRELLEGKGENAKMRADRSDLDMRTAEMLSLARQALESENVNWNVATQRRIATSLRTLPSATPEDRQRLLAGRLEKDLDTSDDDSLLETALGLSGVELKRASPHKPVDLPRNKPVHQKAHTSPAQTKEAKLAEQREREKERHEREEKARRAAEQLARERAHAQRIKFLEREAEHLESKATYAEEAAVKARAAADVARQALKSAKAQKP